MIAGVFTIERDYFSIILIAIMIRKVINSIYKRNRWRQMHAFAPSIFFQSHSLIVPSGSLEDDPSNEILSVGKVITWLGHAVAVGGLLFSLQPSQDFSLLQKLKNKIPAIKASNKRVCFGFKKKVLWFNSFSLKKN